MTGRRTARLAVLVAVWAAIALAVAVRAFTAAEAKLERRELQQDQTIRRYSGTLRFFAHHRRLARTQEGRRAARRARVWVRVVQGELAETRAEMRAHRPQRSLQSVGGVGYWAAKQIAAASTIAAESSGDPWPNCPDPYDGSGASWQDTVDCENSGSWFDSPGFFRCGLQFDPSWERRFGLLCPY